MSSLENSYKNFSTTKGMLDNPLKFTSIDWEASNYGSPGYVCQIVLKNPISDMYITYVYNSDM